MIPVLLDMDNALGNPVQDVDDGVALALALASSELNVRGIAASACNCSAADAERNTLRLLELAGRTDIPVARGAEVPLVADRTAHHAFLETKRHGPGSVYWRSLVVPPVTARADTRTAAELICDCVRDAPGKLVLVMQGALTNLALALREAPDIGPRIREVVHMGGVFAPQEGERPFVWQTPDVPETVWRDTLRFNTWYDPEATVEVVRSGVPVRFISANVTVHVVLTLAAVGQMRDAAGDDPYRRFLADACEPWVRWSMEQRGLSGAHMHDPLAVATVFRPDLCRYVTMHADCDAFLDGQDWLLRAPHAATVPVSVAVDVDAPAFEELLMERLAGPA